MLTTSANAISYDDGHRCIEARRMPDGRWAIATGVSVRGTGKSPWSPFTRDFFATEAEAARTFLAALPDDPTLRDRAVRAWKDLTAAH
ncbi:MAG: hypothetical protein ACR2JW_03930 [Thermomicrobiales bacterium]